MISCCMLVLFWKRGPNSKSSKKILARHSKGYTTTFADNLVQMGWAKILCCMQQRRRHAEKPSSKQVLSNYKKSGNTKAPPIRHSLRWSFCTTRIWRVHFLPNPTLQSCSLAEPWPVQRWYFVEPSKLPNLKPWIWRRIILPHPGMRGPFEFAQETLGPACELVENCYCLVSSVVTTASPYARFTVPSVHRQNPFYTCCCILAPRSQPWAHQNRAILCGCSGDLLPLSAKSCDFKAPVCEIYFLAINNRKRTAIFSAIYTGFLFFPLRYPKTCIQYRVGVWWVHNLYPVLGLGFRTFIAKHISSPDQHWNKNRSPRVCREKSLANGNAGFWSRVWEGDATKHFSAKKRAFQWKGRRQFSEWGAW